MFDSSELTKEALMVLKAESRANCRCGNTCARHNIDCVRVNRENAIKRLEELGISLESDNRPYANTAQLKKLGITLESDNNHYSVYVIELSKNVLLENKFQKHNPRYLTGKPCVYVGMTGITPEERFKKHKAGIKSNVYAERYGIHLLPSLYEKYNPMSFENAKAKEIELAIALQNKGYGVWQA